MTDDVRRLEVIRSKWLTRGLHGGVAPLGLFVLLSVFR